MEKSVKLLKLAARLDKTSMEKYKDQNINNWQKKKKMVAN